MTSTSVYLSCTCMSQYSQNLKKKRNICDSLVVRSTSCDAEENFEIKRTYHVALILYFFISTRKRVNNGLECRNNNTQILLFHASLLGHIRLMQAMVYIL